MIFLIFYSSFNSPYIYLPYLQQYNRNTKKELVHLILILLLFLKSFIPLFNNIYSVNVFNQWFIIYCKITHNSIKWKYFDFLCGYISGYITTLLSIISIIYSKLYNLNFTFLFISNFFLNPHISQKPPLTKPLYQTHFIYFVLKITYFNKTWYLIFI